MAAAPVDEEPVIPVEHAVNPEEDTAGAGLAQADALATAMAAAAEIRSALTPEEEAKESNAENAVLNTVETKIADDTASTVNDDDASSYSSSIDDRDRRSDLDGMAGGHSEASSLGAGIPASKSEGLFGDSPPPVANPPKSASVPARLLRSGALQLPGMRRKRRSSSGEDSEGLETLCDRFFGGLARICWRVAIFVQGQMLYMLILLPYVLGFVSRTDEPLRFRPDIWLLRPLYVLVLARLLCAVFFKLATSNLALEVLPVRATVLVEAFRGYPGTLVTFLGLTAIAYYTPHPDSAAWERLRQVQWLIGVQWWLAALGISRALLEAFVHGVFSNLKDDHFQERVDAALLSIRVLRMLFSTARVARAREAQRHRRNSNASDKSHASNPGHGSTTFKSRLSVGGKLKPPAPGGGSTLGFGQGVTPSSSPPPGDNHVTYASGTRHVARELIDGHSELVVAEDSLFSSTLSGLADSLGVLKSSITSSSGFVSSIEDARKRARNTFQSLLAEYRWELAVHHAPGDTTQAPVEREAAEGHIPQERLVRWCTMAVRRKRKAFRERVAARVKELFSYDDIGQAEFVAAVEAAYREQRYISASVDSFDQLNRHMHTFAVIVWAVIIGLAGIFLVDVGINFDDWIFPLSSTFLSFSVLLGWLPFDTAAGILFVLWVKPYDIGDRVSITSPGKDGSNLEVMTVAEIGLLSTRFYSWRGELHSIPNFILRRLAVINHTRSRNQTRIINVQLPATTPGERVSELIDVVRNFVDQAPQDWVAVEAADIKQPDYARGTLTITMALRSAHARVRDGPMTQAETRIYMLVHVYLQSIGIEYTTPVQNITVDVQAPNAPRGADDAVVASES